MTDALRTALADLLKHAERANEIMLHEAGIGVCDVTAIAAARAALAAPPAAPPVPADWWLRSRVLDLLHLLQFSSVSTATSGDDLQAQRVMVELKAALSPETQEEITRQAWLWAMGLTTAAAQPVPATGAQPAPAAVPADPCANGCPPGQWCCRPDCETRRAAPQQAPTGRATPTQAGAGEKP